jgi:uncharacterized protein
MDAAHDMAHLYRVWKNVRDIHAIEGGDLEALCAATILHDAVNLPKDHPDRAKASHLSGKVAQKALTALNWDIPRIDAVVHAIEAHSFSAGIAPKTHEARILQDADRLDAIGAIGIARCFMVGGALDRTLYDPNDPAAQNRDLNDGQFTLEHFPLKLLQLKDSFQTATGRKIAGERHAYMTGFLDRLGRDCGG